MVVLALPLRRPGVPETEAQPAHDSFARYTVGEEDVRDSNAALTATLVNGMDRAAGKFTLNVNAGNQADVKLLPVRDPAHYLELAALMA